MRKRPALVDLDDPRGDDVEEVTVVRHENHRAGEGLQIILQPADRLGVEMVGRLVEQQQIRLAGERTAKRDPAFLAAGKRADHRVERRRAQRGGGGLDPGVEVPAVGVVDEVEQVVELGVATLAVFVAADGFDDVGRARGDVFLHGELGIQLELLRQIADAEGAAQRDFPGIRHLLAGEDFEERGLAAAVAADHARFLPGGDGKRDPIQQRLVTVGQANFVGREESGHEAARLLPIAGETSIADRPPSPNQISG